MNIAIIGTGNIGATLTRRLAAAGQRVRMANSRGPETLAGLAAETGAVPMPVTEVTRDADVVIVAVPQKSIPTLDPAIFRALRADVPVVDTGNYVPVLRDGSIDALDNGAAESRWVESHLGHPVVKAFNTLGVASLRTLGKPAGTPGRIALPVAGDDAPAKARVMELVDQIGFDAVDAGGIDESWRQQPGTPVYTADLDAERVRTALAEAKPDQARAWRDRMASPRS